MQKEIGGVEMTYTPVSREGLLVAIKSAEDGLRGLEAFSREVEAKEIYPFTVKAIDTLRDRLTYLREDLWALLDSVKKGGIEMTIKDRSRVILPGCPGRVGTVVKIDRYPYGAARAYVLWDGMVLDLMGLGPGILTYRVSSLEEVE